MRKQSYPCGFIKIGRGGLLPTAVFLGSCLIVPIFGRQQTAWLGLGTDDELSWCAGDTGGVILNASSEGPYDLSGAIRQSGAGR